MSSWASEIASVLPVSLNSLVEMFLGQDIVRRCWLWVMRLCELRIYLLPLHSDTYRKKNCCTETQPQISLWLNVVHWTTRECVVQYRGRGVFDQSGSGWMDSRTGVGVGCWFVSRFLRWRISSCAIRPGSDPTCPDVPPHPPSCSHVTHSLMNRAGRVQPLSCSDPQCDLARIFNCRQCRKCWWIHYIILFPSHPLCLYLKSQWFAVDFYPLKLKTDDNIIINITLRGVLHCMPLISCYPSHLSDS